MSSTNELGSSTASICCIVVTSRHEDHSESLSAGLKYDQKIKLSSPWTRNDIHQILASKQAEGMSHSMKVTVVHLEESASARAQPRSLATAGQPRAR